MVLDNIRSLHNVGSIFRTSDAARLNHLYLAGITGTPENHALRRTALGAEEVVPWTHVPSALETVRRLKGEGYTIAVLELTDAPTPIDALAAEHFPLCLVVGNEVEGVDEAVISEADVALEIPQFGIKQSLNVSVAFGIAAYDLVRTCRSTHASIAM